MNSLRFTTLIVVLATQVLSTASLNAQEWVRFRGPNGTGLSETEVPTDWTQDELAWKVKLPGVGHSSPVVWGDHVFLMSGNVSDATQYVVAIHLETGERLWQREFPLTSYHIHPRNSFASSTPTVDANHVYAAWSDETETTLVALDHDGQTVWKRAFERSFDSQHGFGASPIVYDDLVVLSVMQKKPQRNGPRVQKSNVVACRRATGQVVWDTSLWSDSVSYATPCVLRRPGRSDQLILCNTANGIFSLDPSDGRMNWSVEAFDKRTVSSPVIADGIIFGSTGSGGGGNYVAAVRLDPEPSLAYEITSQVTYVPTLVAKDGLAYLWSDKGIVTCIKVADGKRVWQQRIQGDYSGSPILAGKHLYCIDDDGIVTVIKAGEVFEQVSRIPLGGPSRSTPAVVAGRLLLRTYSQLICVDH